MTVIEIASPGGPERLRPSSRPVPTPGDGEVLIRVIAAGVNRPDIMQRQGLYAPPPGASDILGLEVAGEIVALGPHVSGFVVRDRVTALLAGGGYAGYAIASAGLCLPIPNGFSMVEAAAGRSQFSWRRRWAPGFWRPREALKKRGPAKGSVRSAGSTTARKISSMWF